MDVMKVKKIGLSCQLQDLSVKNDRNQRKAYKASRMNTAIIKLKKSLKTKNRKIRILTNNLTLIKTELETLCLHIYKMDSMLVTTTNSMERILKVI
jgi:predicted RNase H-like nuclease (RuvC/YqgF family)